MFRRLNGRRGPWTAAVGQARRDSTATLAGPSTHKTEPPISASKAGSAGNHAETLCVLRGEPGWGWGIGASLLGSGSAV